MNALVWKFSPRRQRQAHGYFRRKAKERGSGNSPQLFAFWVRLAAAPSHQQLLTGLVARKEKGGRNGSDKTSKGEREPDEMIHYMHGK